MQPNPPKLGFGFYNANLGMQGKVNRHGLTPWMQQIKLKAVCEQ